VVAKSTQDIKPNPHANHITTNDLDCTSCHKGHDADVVYCTNCHKGLSFKRTPATSKN
jgi:fumarate reductase flavoprotein subunit